MPLINTFDPSVAVNTGTDIITINGHGFIDRQGVIYHTGGGTAVGALVDGYKYYIISVSINTFKLALTEENAGDSIAVDLLSVGSGSLHSFETSNIYPNSAAYYDFFRKVRLLGNGTDPGGNTLEADSVRDNMTIVAGDNIVFENISEEQDTFTISGSEYDFEVPVGTTELRLYGRVGPVITDDQSIRFTVDRGINITRISDTELRFEGLGVTETDTLHSVTERGAITSNTIYLNNLEVGIIQSIPGEDGITNFTSTGTTGVFINLTGDGTLDSPGEIDLPSTSETSKTVYVNFTTPVSGTLTYSASYKAESALSTGSVILQRETPGSPGTWVTIDSASGTTSRVAYTIQNVYAEPNTGPTNFRIITAWTGLSTGYIDFPINLQFEISPIYVNEMIRTDTSAGELYLGRIDGEVYLRGDINIRDRINTDGLYIYQNVIQGTNSNGDVVIDPSGTGGVELRTQILNTDQTTFNLLDTVATTINVFGAATAINMGANTGTLTIENPIVVGTVAIQNLYNTNASTVNAFGDAATLNIGDNSGTVTLRNPTLVGTETTQNVYDTVATTVNAFGTAATLNIGEDSGTVTLRNPTLVGTQTTQNVYDTVATTVNAFGAATTIDIGATTGTITVNNPTLVGTQTTQNVYDTVATTVNAFGAATTIDIGSTTGTITINNPTLVGTQTTQNLYNTVATTVNFAGASTLVEIGAATGDTNVNNNLVVDLDLQVKGGDITTDQTTFNLLNTTATTINAFGAASTINLRNLVITSSNTIDSSDSSGITFIPLVTFNSDVVVENDLTVNRDMTVGTNLAVTGAMTVGTDLTVTGDLVVNGNTVTLNTTTLDIEDLNITVAKGATSAAAANGAGLTVNGPTTPATLTYVSSGDKWNFNKSLQATQINDTPVGFTSPASGRFSTLSAISTVTLGSSGSSLSNIQILGKFASVAATLRADTTATNTLSLAAYDTDSPLVNPATGPGWDRLVILTSGTEPTLTLTSTGVGTINNMSIGATTPSTGKFTTLEVRDTTTTAFDLFLASNSSVALTADRTLTIDVENASRTIALGGNIDLANSFTTVGNFDLSFTTTASTSLILPTTGTLATIAGSESLSNKKLGSLTTNGIVTTSGSDGTLSVTATTGSGSVVLGTAPTVSGVTHGSASSTSDADVTVDAATTTFYAYVQSASGTTRTINISNLTAGRMIKLYLRNTNAATKVINITASTTTTGFAAVNMATGQPSGTSVTSVALAATSGTWLVTVFNANGVFCGSL